MKLNVLALCIFAVSVNGHRFHDYGGFAGESFKECIKENNITSEEFAALNEKNDPKLHCLKACVLKKTNILLSDGTIDTETVRGYLKNVFVKSEQDDAIRTLNACIVEGKDEENVCTRINIISECFRQKIVPTERME